jgi:hypothetical protein
MATNVLVFGFGAILLLVAILGGGFELRKFTGPKVSSVSRAIAGVIGMLFIGWGVSIGTSETRATSGGSQGSKDPAALALAQQPRSPTPAARPGAWESQLRRQLVDAAVDLTRAGYQLTHETQTGSLRTDGSDDLTLTLYGGVSYAVVGVCDNDCSNLDLVLYDAEGNVVDTSQKPNPDTPFVVVAPNESAQYRVRVTMAACAVEPCLYGVGVFGK